MRWKLIALSVGSMTLLAAFLPADVSKESQSDGPVPIQEIERRGIGGRLGHPLGEVVSVAGLVIDGNNAMASKFSSYHFYLEVDTLNGKRLEKPVTVTLREEDKAKLVAGSHVKLIGWETGGCRGLVNDPNSLLGPGLRAADIQYTFICEFVIGSVQK